MFASSTKASILRQSVTFSMHYPSMRNTSRRSRLTRSIEALLIRKGFNCHFPRQITHGPQAWGGLGILDIKTEGGLSQIKEFLHALYGDSEPGKLMMYSLKYSQMESGLGFNLLEDLKVFISWLTPTWTMSLRAFLFNHNITITLTDCWHFPLCCKHDQYLMEPALTGTSFTSSEHEHTNCVRMHLQVATVGQSYLFYIIDTP